MRSQSRSWLSWATIESQPLPTVPPWVGALSGMGRLQPYSGHRHTQEPRSPRSGQRVRLQKMGLRILLASMRWPFLLVLLSLLFLKQY